MKSSPGSCCSSTNCLSPSISPEVQQSPWLKGAIALVVFTILYALLEGGLTLWLGIQAHSITLESFGLDSLLEISAAALLLWRLSLQAKGAGDQAVENAEGQVHRFVGASFLLLAVYVLWSSGSSLLNQDHAHPSQWGLILTILSVVIMPVLAGAKLRVARQINSKAMTMEAKETLACGMLSIIALAGLALNAAFGWWWADPVAAIAMLPWLVKEGLAGVRGVSCCG